MIAVIQTGSKQYKVKENQVLHIEKLPVSKGEDVVFDQVLLVSDDAEGDIKVGTPFVKSAKVTAKVLDQVRTKKIDIIKFKNKVRYTRKNGHRQPQTKIRIMKIEG